MTTIILFKDSTDRTAPQGYVNQLEGAKVKRRESTLHTAVRHEELGGGSRQKEEM